jgi:hypothetical protein
VTIEKYLLNPFGDSLGGTFAGRLGHAVSFLVHLSKPDHTLPMIGDGSPSTLDNLPAQPSYSHVSDHPELRHVLSDGAEGKAPARLLAAYREEGYAFMRTSWDYKSRRDEITYASFRAGHKITNHKHADDLSFTLHARGRDIFVDGGTYTYEPGEFRRYFVSALAHNTVVVDGRNYPVFKSNPAKAGILASGEQNGVFFVIAKNDMYAGVRLTRAFYFLARTGRIVIVDEAESGKPHVYSQLFHLSHRLDARRVDLEGGRLTAVVQDDVSVRLTQLVPCDVAVHRGDTKRAAFGVVSDGFNSIHQTTTLEYRQSGRGARFVTTIAVDGSQDTPFDAWLGRRAVHVRDEATQIRLPAVRCRPDTTPFPLVRTGLRMAARVRQRVLNVSAR